MFIYSPINSTKHTYSFACTGLDKKIKEKEFSSRDAANHAMYKYCQKFGLNIDKVYDDNHDKTYVCSNGVRFYIHRI